IYVDALTDIAALTDLRARAHMGKVPDLRSLADGFALHNGCGMSIIGLGLILRIAFRIALGFCHSDIDPFLAFNPDLILSQISRFRLPSSGVTGKLLFCRTQSRNVFSSTLRGSTLLTRTFSMMFSCIYLSSSTRYFPGF